MLSQVTCACCLLTWSAYSLRLEDFHSCTGAWYGGYISPSHCGLAALAFLGLFPYGTQVLGFVGFFYFDSTHCQPTPHLEREHGLRRSLPDDLIWLCSSPKTRMRLLVWTYFPHTCGTHRTPSIKQFLSLIIKGSESRMLISSCATKKVKLRQEHIYM